MSRILTNKRIFIASSSEGINIARAVFSTLENDFLPIIWDQFIFSPSRYAIEILEEQLERINYAVLIASPDDILISRGVEKSVARDNVLIEIGMFIGALGRKKTFILCPNKPKIDLPSDLFGLSFATYDASRLSDDFSGNRAAVETACQSIIDTIKKEKNKELYSNPDEYEAWLCDSITKIFEKSNANEDNEFILNLGVAISKELWVRGHYETLKSIGIILEETASRESNIDLQVEALIDHLGWMVASNSDLINGAKYIHLGLDFALEHGLFHKVSKAYRHLAAIELKKVSPIESEALLAKALNFANKIEDEDFRLEHLAPIYYGLSELCLRNGRLSEAVKYHENAKETYKKVGKHSNL